jgi:adhesin transport system outer membrane protein
MLRLAGRTGGGVALSIACALLLAGCATNRPSACETSTDTYPLPGNLCQSYASLETPPDLRDPQGGGPLRVSSGKPLPEPRKKAGGRLSVPQLVRTLIGTNPDIGISAAREKEQFSAIAGAEVGLYPTVDLTAAVGPQRNFQPDPIGNGLRRETGLNIRQNLYDFGAAQENVNRATLAYHSASNARIARSEQTTFDMLDLLLKTQQIDRTMVVTNRNIEAHEGILKIVQSNERDGNSTVADVKRVTTRLESARSTLIDLATDRTNAADAFRRLTDVEVDLVVDRITPRLGGDPARLTPPRLEANPEIVAIKNEITSLRHQVESVRAQGLPSVGLESNLKMGRQMTAPDSTVDRKTYANVLLSVRVPLFDGGANESTRQQVVARLEAAQLKLDKRRRELAEDAKGAQRISQSDPEKSGSLVTRVEAARKVKELYLEQFKDGNRTIFELLDSQVDLVKAETDLIAQDTNRRRTRIKTLLLEGTLVRTVLAAKGG